MEITLPNILFIEMTNFCNMHCIFCPSDLLTKKRQHISEDDLKEFLSQVHELDIRPPILCNILGEPLINKNIYKYLDLFEEHGHPVTLITNMSMLKDISIVRTLLGHDNLTVALSLQTPTRRSYKMKKYPKLKINEFFRLIFDVIEEKFKMGSSTRLEMHVASNYIVTHDPALRADSDIHLWEIFPDRKKEERWLKNLLKKLENFADKINKKYPAQYLKEMERTLQVYKDHIGSRLAISRESLPENFHRLKGEEFWGYMFMPNVILQLKSLELWTNDHTFVKAVMPEDKFVFIEERTAPLACHMAGNLGMLANGDLVFCCLDYEGEMKLGNIKNTRLKELLFSGKRTQVLQNAMNEGICRRCKGNVFVFDTKPLKTGSQVVDKFGQGWEPYEKELYGIGGRWTRGHAIAYVFTRIRARSISLRFFSELFQSTECKLKIYSYNEKEKIFYEECSKSFLPEKGKVNRLEAEIDFSPFKLYKIELFSPTFVPDEVIHNEDKRQLGLAVFDIRLRN
jgi:sulfatase maturation enzyme AslB (radical SAM superfamily)